MLLILPGCLSLRANWLFYQTTTYKLMLEEISPDYGTKSTISEGKILLWETQTVSLKASSFLNVKKFMMLTVVVWCSSFLFTTVLKLQFSYKPQFTGFQCCTEYKLSFE